MQNPSCRYQVSVTLRAESLSPPTASSSENHGNDKDNHIDGFVDSDSGMHTHTFPPETDMGEENRAVLGLLRREDVCVSIVAV
jgi:hypothetical protein